jgi:hypothetical protein
MALQRILIKTHHMTSHKKIAIITRATKCLDCSVVLKVGAPPGIMLCEGQENCANEWETVVRVSSEIHFKHSSNLGKCPQSGWATSSKRRRRNDGEKKTNGHAQKLRYKDMQLLKREEISEPHLSTLGVKEGDVREIEEIKDFAKFLEKDPSLYRAWRVGMGYVKDHDEQ